MPTNPFYTTPILNGYQQKFDTIVVNKNFTPVADTFLNKMIANKAVYEAIEKATGVPWYFVGALHMRESGMNFNGHLHNGDPLTGRTFHVPAGYPKAAPQNGKSYTFVESAIDSLRLLKLDKWTDWTVKGMLHKFELWNGTGYIRYGRSNPYLWSGTQYYTGGKYVADGKYSSTAIDKQLGVAALIKKFLTAYPVYEKKKPSIKSTVVTSYRNISDYFGFFLFGK
jgi:lysozyme family protein